MIPEAAITHWRNVAPWPQDAQVEQDLILSQALTEIFEDPLLSKSLLLRGGTALHKLLVKAPYRYSEDIDLVQIKPEPIGLVMSAIRARLDDILGKPRRENNPDNVTLRYRMESEIAPVTPMRLKIEINTREHFMVYEPEARLFAVQSPWFTGRASVRTYALDELLGTKLRALYQRRKGRDLFDLWVGLEKMGAKPKRVADAFRKYLEKSGHKITRRQFELNLEEKIETSQFNEDLRPLLAAGIPYDAAKAARIVTERLLVHL